MYYKLALLTSIFSSTWFTSCACSSVGPCPKLEGLQDVNLTKFAGHWHEIERSFYLMELIRSCVSIDLTKVTDKSLAVVVNTKITWTDTFSISKGNASRTRKDPSVFFYRVSCGLPGNLNRYLPGSGHYRILKTDYVNYAVIYSCTDFKVVHLDMLWIWGRKNEIGPALRSEIYSMLSDNHLDSERLILSKNKNCTDD